MIYHLILSTLNISIIKNILSLVALFLNHNLQILMIYHLILSTLNISIIKNILPSISFLLLLLSFLFYLWCLQLGQQSHVLILARIIIVGRILSLVIVVHDTMADVLHMLLAALGRAELLGALEAERAQMDALGDVGEQSLQVGQTVNIKDKEVVTIVHVVQVLLDSITLLVAEQADA